MKRRHVVALGAAGLALPANLVGWMATRTSDVPRGMDVDSLYVDGDPVVRPDEETFGGDDVTYATLLTSRADASARTEDDREVRSFLSGTDFETSYVAVVQTWASPDATLELDGVDRTGDRLSVAASVDYPPGGYSEVAAPHTLLLRITDPDVAVPSGVTASVER